MDMNTPYQYPINNSDLIRFHSLESHLEGGYFVQTVSLESHANPIAKTSITTTKGRTLTAWGPGTVLTGGKAEGTPGEDVDATAIYYLLTPDSYRGRMHMNYHAVCPRCSGKPRGFKVDFGFSIFTFIILVELSIL